MNQNNPFDYLTSLRGIAALWVVFYHVREFLPASSFLDIGYLAVDFFFILSGFVISLAYQDFFYSTANTSLLSKSISFYKKRIIRLFPLHLFVLLMMLSFYLLIALLKGENIFVARFAPTEFVYQALLIQNWGISQQVAWNIPSWSISTELLAYVFFPLLILLLRKLSVTRLIILSGMIMGILAVVFSQKNALNLGDEIMSLGAIRCLAEFTLGMIVYKLHVVFDVNKIRFISIPYLLACVLVVVLIYFGIENYYYVPALLLLTFFAFLNMPQGYRQLLATPKLLWLGNISFSIYLIHYLFRDTLKFSVASLDDIGFFHITIYVVSVIFVSHFTYEFIEKRSKQHLNKFFMGKAKSQ